MCYRLRRDPPWQKSEDGRFWEDYRTHRLSVRRPA
jgi:hypothetical protein